MSTQYNHLSIEERVTIMVMLLQRQTQRAIAVSPGCHPQHYQPRNQTQHPPV